MIKHLDLGFPLVLARKQVRKILQPCYGNQRATSLLATRVFRMKQIIS